jgi:hypothetical protein
MVNYAWDVWTLRNTLERCASLFCLNLQVIISLSRTLTDFVNATFRNYNPVANPGYWSIALSSINVNGQAVSGTSSAAAIDTGTTLIYLPMNSYNALYTALGGSQTASGGWTVPCGNTRSVGFVFGGVSYLIPLAELNLGYASASTTTQCLYGIFGSTTVDVTGAPMAVVRCISFLFPTVK